MSLFRTFYDPWTDFDRLFDNAFYTRFQGQSAPQRSGQEGQQLTRTDSTGRVWFQPKMDIREDSDANTVTALFELPGLKKEDVNIDVHNNRLTVSGDSKSSSEREEEGWVIRERSYGSFSRSLQLPAGVKPDEIKAKMEHGVLAVTFPKTTAEQAPKKITVS